MTSATQLVPSCPSVVMVHPSVRRNFRCHVSNKEVVPFGQNVLTHVSTSCRFFGWMCELVFFQLNPAPCRFLTDTVCASVFKNG